MLVVITNQKFRKVSTVHIISANVYVRVVNAEYSGCKTPVLESRIGSGPAFRQTLRLQYLQLIHESRSFIMNTSHQT